MPHRLASLLILVGLLGPDPVAAKGTVLDARLHHLRVTPQREWADFPPQAEGPRLSVHFRSQANAGEWSLRLRQQDVRETWKVLLNGKELGRLPPDENDMVIYLPVPAGWLHAGDNALAVEQVGRAADDVYIGEITLDDRPARQVLAETAVEVTVQEAGRPLPCRITVVNDQGALMTVGASSGQGLAVRPGVVYTATGKARFGLPAGHYTLYAGRGFEYGIDSARLALRPGDVVHQPLRIRREVPTPGYVSCDTHVHTLTYSGHGDASVDERAVTLAGEGIELPIATDHNVQVDYGAAALRMKVRDYFTPVVGNEVTTNVGHFNIFPVRAGGPVPDFQLKDWKSLAQSIQQRAGPRVVILNHPRDRHAGFRPFDPSRFLALTGEDLAGWVLPANGMEVVNSGAQQTDFMRSFHDWFGLLNRGVYLTPVGASDSHDVARYIVGQGRTYIRCPDDRPGQIDMNAAVAGFLQGRVLVSCGLLAEITVNGRYGPGDLVPNAEQMTVHVRVLGPSWVKADRVELYANGHKIREARITGEQEPGVKWAGEWALPRFRHDVFLSAVACGPGVKALYWPIARPYQHVSPKVDRRVIGATGAVWIDGDGDGKKSCAYDYARRLVDSAWPRVPDVIGALAGYDEAVAAQAAGLLRARGVALNEPVIREAARKAGPHVERAFQAYAEAWRESQVARSESP
jgi:hypothetical protein